MSDQLRKKESTPDQRNLSDHMYDSITIKNFRCFKDFTIGSFNKINLITGFSNAGKTALLEAIYLLQDPNNPEMILNCKAIRGINSIEANENILWDDLFCNMEIENVIRISGKFYNKKGTVETLEMRLIESDTEEQSSTDKIIELLSTSSSPFNKKNVLESKYQSLPDEEYSVSRSYIKENIPRYQNPFGRKIKNSTYLSPSHRIGENDTTYYSDLVTEGKQQDLIEILKKFEPRLTDLTVHAAPGNAKNFVYAHLGLKKAIPLKIMGGGICKLFSLYVRLMYLNNGLLLIDELETGFHYSELPLVWKTLKELADNNNIQIFATTHSLECIRAAHYFFSEQPSYDFSFYRLDNFDGEVSYVKYEKDTLDAAIEINMEVR